MSLFQCRFIIISILILSLLFQGDVFSAPINVSSLATAKGCLFAGTYSGKIFVSPDSGLHWIDECLGLCDSSSLGYQKMVKCIKVAGNDSIHAITACGEFVSTAPEIHWKQLSADSCVLEYCPKCIMNMKYYAQVNAWVITADISGQIDWSRDGGKTWANAVPGCPQCSMPIINCLYFDSISVLAGLYGGYGSAIGYHSNIIMSIDSGRTWRVTGLAENTLSINSITRMGSIAFASSEKGIYASRDDFTTWWMVGESSEAEQIAFQEPLKKQTAIAFFKGASQSAFVISIKLNAAALTSISLCDLSGKRIAVLLRPTTFLAGIHRIPLSLNEKFVPHAGGIFMCVVRVGGVVETFRILVIR